MFSLAVIINSSVLSISLLLVLFLGIIFPGFLFKRVVASSVRFTALESFFLSFALGLGILNASLLLLGNIPLTLNALTIGIWYGILFIIFFSLLFFRNIPLFEKPTSLLTSKKEIRVAIIFVVLLFFIKVFYLSGSILPTSTDLGHHLYWAKLTTDTQALPIYEKQEIVRSESGVHSLSQPEAISDFIIGEHLPISFIHIFTGASYFGTFPTLFLFFLNISSVFALTLLLYEIGKEVAKKERWTTVKPSLFFLTGLFVFGSLFSLASPEMKFVSGGVIGNLFGNFFIPLILLLLLRALSEKSQSLISLALILLATLAYTHHLSTFILLFVLVFSLLTCLLFWQKQFFTELKKWLFLALKPAPLITVASIILFALFITLPTYLETNAVGTAVGTPTKDTRTGLTLAQLTASNSAFKLGLALFGLFLIAGVAALRKNLGTAILFGYSLVLLVMTMAPQLLLVDIPSNRISHYLSFPLTLLALFVTLYLVEKFGAGSFPEGKRYRHSFVIAGFVIIWLALVAPGLEDNGRTLSVNSQGLYVKETFTAAEYLQKQILPGELILKDHNFIEASDTWMKLFFSQGYNYPLSRSYFQRYEDNPEREHCTLAMIATPNTSFGKQCYQELPVRFLVVNPKYDQAQFLKSPRFSLVYSSPNVAIFQFNPSQQ